jgi:predicted dehydrogenase
MQKVPPPSPVPDTLDWDVWLGGAERREFTAGGEEYKTWVAANEGKRFGKGGSEFGFYLPFNWRGFFDFGSGLFGDWGVHVLGPANWGLQLSPESLVSVEAIKKEGATAFTYPLANTVKYEFAARGKFPPVTVYWSDSVQGDGFLPPGITSEQARRIPNTGPQVGAGQQPAGRYNCIFTGSKGYMGTGGRGESVGLLPGSRWAEYKLPQPYLTRSPGAGANNHHAAHCRDWVRACKGGAPACSNFSIAGPFTEWLVLGAVATHYEGKLLWDPAKLAFRNNKDATRWIKPTYRKGWGIKL